MIGTVDPSKEITKSRPLLLLYRRIGRKVSRLAAKGLLNNNTLCISSRLRYMCSASSTGVKAAWVSASLRSLMNRNRLIDIGL